jgi:hypothetical protein
LGKIQRPVCLGKDGDAPLLFSILACANIFLPCTVVLNSLYWYKTGVNAMPDRVYDGKSYFSVTHAHTYFGMSKSGFQDYIKRMKVQKWEIPAGSQGRYILKNDLDKLLTPAPAKQIGSQEG